VVPPLAVRSVAPVGEQRRPDRSNGDIDLSQYPVEGDLRERLFALQTECAVVWSTRDGWPVGVMHRYLWHDGRFWVSTMGHRKRVVALRDRPKSSVIVSGENVAPGWRDLTVTAKTIATVHDATPAITDWFYPALAARRTGGDAERAASFVRRLDAPGRVVIELEPQAWITYDGAKVAAHVAGRWALGEDFADPRLVGDR
jgi:hypothetical protein